jgi:hypothetical protein
VNTARAEFQKVSTSVDSLKGKLNLIAGMQGAQLFAGIASGAANAARNIAAIGSATADAITEQSRFAAKIGVPLAAFAALAEAADEVGVSQAAVTSAVQKMGVALVKAQEGSKPAAEAFKAIGLSAAELSAMAPEKAFEKIVDEIGKLPTPAERTAAALKIFGRTGKDLGPLFEAGGQAIAAAAAEVELFGMALDDASGKNVEKMKNSFGDMGAAFEGFKTQVVAAFSPAVTGVIQDLLQRLADAGGMVPVAMEFSKIMAVTVGTLVDGAMSFAATITEALKQVASTFGYIDAFAKGGYALAQRAAGAVATGAGYAASISTDARESGVAASLIASGQELFDAAKATSARADARFNGQVPDASGAPTTGGKFAATMLAEIARMEQSYNARKAERAAADTKANEGAAAAATKANEKQTETAKQSLNYLRDIARQIGLVVGAPPAVFNIAGAGGR